MAKGRKVGLFGGTFDPIHSAHLIVAMEAVEQAGLDEVLFVPAANPPHKTGATGADYEHRYRMVELACATAPEFTPSRLEEGAGKSYSVLTIAKLREQLSDGDEIHFLIGADAFAEIRTWYRWEDVVRTVVFVVVTRPGHEYEVPPGTRVHRLETLALPVSSSEIRRKLAAGEPARELPAAVGSYIEQHGLYRGA
jgi:nicotinate-nucleotide adenylyltransferase